MFSESAANTPTYSFFKSPKTLLGNESAGTEGKNLDSAVALTPPNELRIRISPPIRNEMGKTLKGGEPVVQGKMFEEENYGQKSQETIP
jgi:hypothetical protein